MICSFHIDVLPFPATCWCLFVICCDSLWLVVFVEVVSQSTCVCCNAPQPFEILVQLDLHEWSPKGDAFATGLATVLIVQGCFNFIPWPIFESVFGENHTPALWILAFSSVLLYVWPVIELWRYGIQEAMLLLKIVPSVPHILNMF